MWSVLIARLAKMRIVEEKQEMVEQVKVKIARRKSHLVATIKLCSLQKCKLTCGTIPCQEESLERGLRWRSR